MGIGDAWSLLFFQPMLNGLLLLYGLLGSNFALTVIAFTIVVRSLMLPLTLKQLHSSKAMMALQPKIQELQKRHGKNREELSKATMALYKEHGVNPVGCAVPTLLQFPIWIGLYQSITLAMADRPDSLFELGKHLYTFLPSVVQALPLNNGFLWLNLAQSDPVYILPVLVAATTFLQQKMMTMPSSDPQQQQMNQMMGYMMPLMMGYFTINFPSGLALYWFTSNIYSMVTQYFVTGWGSLTIPYLIPASSTSPVVAAAHTSKRDEDSSKRSGSEAPESKARPRSAKNGTYVGEPSAAGRGNEGRKAKKPAKRTTNPRRS